MGTNAPLVDIAEELRNRGEKIRILCAGSGEAALMDSLRQKISEKDLGEYICLLGVRKDIDVLMRKSSAFVLPSKYEGMPLVMIEAQASGLPCVSADTYSREVDFEIDGVTWLSLDDGVSVWTDALIAAVNRPRASKDKVEAAVQAKNFDAKRFAQILCELYENDYKEQMHD